MKIRNTLYVLGTALAIGSYALPSLANEDFNVLERDIYRKESARGLISLQNDNCYKIMLGNLLEEESIFKYIKDDNSARDLVTNQNEQFIGFNSSPDKILGLINSLKSPLN